VQPGLMFLVEEIVAWLELEEKWLAALFRVEWQ
jgi:hypothetical protein